MALLFVKINKIMEITRLVIKFITFSGLMLIGFVFWRIASFGVAVQYAASPLSLINTFGATNHVCICQNLAYRLYLELAAGG